MTNSFVVLAWLLSASVPTVQAQGGEGGETGVDSLLVEMWEAAITGAEAGIECLEAPQQVEDRVARPDCEPMRVQFVRFDSLAQRVLAQPDTPDPLPVTVWQVPLADVAESLLELADSVVATMWSRNEVSVMDWDANLRSVWITAHQERNRLLGEGNN